jgi:hypothetical protein
LREVTSSKPFSQNLGIWKDLGPAEKSSGSHLRIGMWVFNTPKQTHWVDHSLVDSGSSSLVKPYPGKFSAPFQLHQVPSHIHSLGYGGSLILSNGQKSCLDQLFMEHPCRNTLKAETSAIPKMLGMHLKIPNGQLEACPNFYCYF